MTILAPVTRMADLVPLIEKNPELDVVIDHMADAQPAQLEKLLALARFPRVFVKISHVWTLSKLPYPYADAIDQLKRLRDGFGAGRLMWGTDWPVSLNKVSYEQAVRMYRDYLLWWMTEEEQVQVLSGTVQKVWPF